MVKVFTYLSLLLLIGYGTVRGATPPVCLTVTASVTPESCPNNADGAIDLTVSGGNPPYVYDWSTGDGLPDLTGLTNGTYSVTISDSLGCEVVDTFQVALLGPAPVAQTGPDTLICSTTAPLFATPPASGSGQWQLVSGSGNIGAVTSTNTLVTNLAPGANTFAWVVSAGNCADADTVEIYAYHAAFTDAGGDRQLCGPNDTLQGSSPGPGIGTWTGPGGVLFSDSNDANSSVQLPQPGTYTLTWSINEAGCFFSDQVQLEWLPPVAAGFSFQPNLLEVNFTDQSQAANGLRWLFGDGSFSTQTNPVYTYAGPGVYNVCQIAEDSCRADTLCQSITVSCPAPIAAFNYNVSGTFVNFSDISATNGTVSGWEWQFGDGDTSNLQNPTHFYTSPGPFTVCLEVVDACGVAVDCQEIFLSAVGEDLTRAERAWIYPQPVAHQAYVKLEGWASGTVTVRVRDVLGKWMGEESVELSGGSMEMPLDVRSWAPGIYFIEVAGATQRQVLRLFRP